MDQRRIEMDKTELALAKRNEEMNQIEMACMKLDHNQEKLQKDLDMFGVLWKQLEERTAKVAAREKEIKSFRRHGKGTR